MTFSLIIPTLNAGYPFLQLLNVLKKQTLQPSEIIIIDSSSTDNTCDIAKDYGCRVETIARSSFDHGGTRTLAAQMAKGEILLFLTQDALPTDNKSFEQLIQCFSDSHIGAAYGRQIPHSDASVFACHLRMFNYPSHSYTRDNKKIATYGIKTAFLSNSFCAYRRDGLKTIGWFKNNLILGEDMIAGAMLLSAGYSLEYQSEAKVYHSHNYSLSQEFNRYFDIGVLHHKESWLLERFGKAEGEGIKFVISELKFLIHQKKYFLLFSSFIRTICKYTGYKLGTIHFLFPTNLSKKLSMHPIWWSKFQSSKK